MTVRLSGNHDNPCKSKMGHSNSKPDVKVGEVWTISAQDYILLLKINSKNILVSRDGLKLVIQRDHNTFEEWCRPNASLPVSATYIRLSTCIIPAEIIKGQHTIVDQIGFVQKALQLVRDLQEVCMMHRNGPKWNRSQKHALTWVERNILKAKTHFCRELENNHVYYMKMTE
jgi:hypothetical protein